MSTDHKMLAAAAAMPVISAGLIYFVGVTFPAYGWPVLIPAIVGANMASVVTPKIGSQLATAALVFSWLSAGLLTYCYMTVIDGVWLDMSDHLYPSMGLGVVCSVVAMGLLSKLASDLSKSPKLPETAASKKEKTIALSVGNTMVGLILAYVLVNWCIGGGRIFERQTMVMASRANTKFSKMRQFAEVNMSRATVERLDAGEFSRSAWRNTKFSADDARAAGLRVV